ncbi:MAG: HlyD family efflux transporter periplasmic adaptor subunit [Lachnospiraceae bacterium]|nr:HlyD family efflux transporter periplasmic adaptor subunit [Lachnospiraceae bacterium]
MNEQNETKQKTKKEIVKNLLIIFLIIMLILTFFSNTIMNYSLPEVSTATAMESNVTSKVRGTGVVETAEDYEVMIEENRTVASVKVKVGDEVNEGDVLFELEPVKTTAGASLEGGISTEDSALKEAQELLDSLELEYNKALLDLSPSYAMDNLDIKTAREDLDAAIEKQKKAQSKSAWEAELIGLKKKQEALEVEVSALQSKAETVSGNALKKTNNKLIEKKKALTDVSGQVSSLEGVIASTPDPEEAAEDVRGKQKALDALLIGLSDKKREDGSTQGKANLDLRAQRKKIEDQRELVEKLRNKQNGITDMEVISKNNGVVKSINCIAGDTVTPDGALAVIAVTGNGYSAKFTVTKEQAKLVKQGQEAEILNIWGEDIKASLSSVKPDLENPNNNKQLVFTITGEDVVVGQNLELSVGEKSERYDCVVPNSAIREDNNGKYVLEVIVKSSPLGNRYVLKRNDVTVLASDETSSAVSGELYPYSYVVTNSTKPLEAGMKVRLSDN